MSEPGTDLYEVRQQLREIAEAVASFGRLLMDPTEGDTSIHPEVRGVIVGGAALAGVVHNLDDVVNRSKGQERAVFKS